MIFLTMQAILRYTDFSSGFMTAGIAGERTNAGERVERVERAVPE